MWLLLVLVITMAFVPLEETIQVSVNRALTGTGLTIHTTLTSLKET